MPQNSTIKHIQCGSLASAGVMMADKASVSQRGTGHCLHTAPAGLGWAGLGSWAARGLETWNRVFGGGS